MASDMSLKVKVIPDLRELQKQLQKGFKTGISGATGGGGDEGKKASREQKKGNSVVVNELKGIGTQVGITALIISVFWDAIKPLITILKLFSAVMLILLLPILVPAMKLLAKVMPKILKWAKKTSDNTTKSLAKGEGIAGKFEFPDVGDTGVKGFLKKMWNNIIGNVTALLPKPLKDLANVFFNLVDLWKENRAIFIENLKKLWSESIAALKGIWDVIKASWTELKDNIKNSLKNIWDKIKEVWTGLISKLKKIFTDIVEKVKSLLSKLTGGLIGGGRRKKGGKKDDFISRPGQPAQDFSSDDTIIGIKDPSKLGGGGAITININNPTVRNQGDIRAIADQVSRVLAQQQNRRFSGR